MFYFVVNHLSNYLAKFKKKLVILELNINLIIFHLL